MSKRKAHVLTDKTETKTLPCTVCGRPCVVNRFAAPAKTRCLDHRERTKSEPAQLHKFDESKEEHVLTTKKPTKRVPCRVCGRPCIVTTFAAPNKIACREHQQIKAKRTVTINRTKDGYQTQTTVEVVDEGQLAWSTWAMCMPFVDTDWDEDTLAKRDKIKAEGLTAREAVRKRRRQIAEIEAKLYSGKPVSVKEGDRLEALRSKLESELESAEAKQTRLTEESNQLARQVWVQSALDRGYRVRKRKDGGHELIGGRLDDPVPFPPQYLDDEHLKAALA